MLVENQLVKVKVWSNGVKYYNDLGYNVKKGDIIYVPIEHLPKGSSARVDVTCDICGKLLRPDYSTYNRRHKYDMDCCVECKHEKSKITNREKYGVDYTSQLPSVKEKVIQTNLERYGVDNPFKNKDIQQKQKETCLEKYGVENTFQAEVCKEKIKQTNLSRYGVERALDNPDIKEKSKRTTLEHFGCESSLQSEEVREKIRQTFIDRYGVDNPMQNKNIRNKAKDTCVQKYGVENPMHLEEVRQKLMETLCKNGNCPTSKPQLGLHKMISNKYPQTELNYPCGVCSLDIFLCIDGVKIDIEYDGWFFHQDKMRDLRRDKVMQKQGIKVLRVRSGDLLPTEEQLFSAIDELVTTDRKFKEIKLKDWREPEQKTEEEVV